MVSTQVTQWQNVREINKINKIKLTVISRKIFHHISLERCADNALAGSTIKFVNNVIIIKTTIPSF